MRLMEKLKIILYSIKKDGLAGLKNLFVAYLNLFREPSEMSSYPVLIQIEPTLYCNFRCQMCLNPSIGRQKRHMQLDEFKRIIDEIPFVRKVSLVGAGEPLLNPDIFAMISYAKSKGILIGFATNGILLNEGINNKIINSETDWMNISIDGADKQTYERIRAGANFELLLDNIRQFVGIKGKKKYPEVSIWFVVMRDNFQELPRVIKLASNLGIKSVTAQIQHYWSSNNYKSNTCRWDTENFKGEICQILKSASKIAKQLKINFNYVNTQDVNTKRQCKWPWRACYITADGFITPCCLHGTDPRIINFGNIFKDEFITIWNNVRYQNFRQQLKSESIPSICVGCPSYYRKITI